ncbi:DUF2892 domain-containing protein [Prosthecochloris sp.]|uniref:YgaP family membrane protein n=1 Tax=Prosthecochloris sp. TaxID=290513 RepID=UPI00257AC960|nr:DUF2892 domain-containing protein [Prosthecochloris sp.]
MQKNIGVLDRNVRIILGSVMLLAGLVFQGWWWLTGLVPLITGIVGFCPLYPLMGFDTAGGYGSTGGYLDPSVKPAKQEKRMPV